MAYRGVSIDIVGLFPNLYPFGAMSGKHAHLLVFDQSDATVSVANQDVPT